MNILQRPLSVVHTGDIQIEVRGQHQRYDEYRFILSQLKDAIIQRKADLYIIAGDIFEHWNANDVERSLFIEHLSEVIEIPHLQEIAIIHGNHDINQRAAYNTYVSDGEDKTTPNAIDTIVTALNSEKIKLFDYSGVYRSGIHGLEYVVWSQKTKHSPYKDKYNPWGVLSEFPESTLICLYHDPVGGTKMWDESEMKNSDRHPSLSDFTERTIIAGDIHKPQTIKNGDKTFVYCGSPVPRNYGEGDYYEDGRLVINGQSNHPYHSFILNQDSTISESVHTPLIQMRGYATFILSNKIKSIDHVSWTIQNPGTNETLVKVKLPSSSEFWVAQELAIINSIREQNPAVKNLSISFVYGKMLTDDTKEQIDSVQIKDLVSQEKINEIAKSYVSKLVAKSSSIPKEDKEKVEDTVNKLFESAIKQFKEVTQSHNISLKSMKCSNFMAFGDNIELDFYNLNSITKLTGGNGVGKTTIYKFIKWMLSGYISSSQNRTKKKENCLVVFNDYRGDIDIVFGELEFYINGKLYTLTRNVSREWNKDVTSEQKHSKDWKTFVKSASMTISLDDKETDIYYNEPAEEKLSFIFGGFEQIEKLCFPDQFTLRSFINTSPASLVDQVLKFVGLGFFDTMLDSYNEFKDSFLAKLEKPAKSTSVLTNELIELQTELENAKSNKNELEQKLEDAKQRMQEYESNIKIHEQSIRVPNAEELLTKCNSDRNSVDIELDELNYKKFHLEEHIKNVKDGLESREMLEQKLENETNHHTALTIDLANTKNKIESLSKDIELKKQEAMSEVNQIKSIYNERCLHINQSISKLQTQIHQLQEQKHEYVLKRSNDKDPEIESRLKAIEDRKKSISSIEIELQTKSVVIDNIQKEIEELENSKICPTCKREYDEESIRSIAQDIETNKNKISNLLHESEAIRKSIDSFNNEIANIQKEIDEWKLNPNSLANQIDATINKLDNEIESIKAAIETNKKKLDSEPTPQELAQTSSVILTLKNEIATLKNELEQTKQSINQKETDISVSNSSIATIKKDLRQLSSLGEYEAKLHETDIEIAKSEQTQQNLTKQIDDLIKEVEHNQRLIDAIYEIKTRINTIRLDEISAYESQLHDSSNKIAVLLNQVETKNTEIENANRYRILEQSFKTYKTLIGKNGLPQHIFKIVSSQLNSKLNDLLEDLNFRLEFNEDNELIMLDMSKNSVPQRSMSQLSGMQTCFAGLSLLYINRECNNQFIFDWLFIDEVSGQLNSGDGLSYESMNYQNQLKILLSKFTSFKTMIVDHVIDDLGESHIIEVTPSPDGSYLNIM